MCKIAEHDFDEIKWARSLERAEMIAGCQAESKALLISKNAQAEIFSSKPDSICETSACPAVFVDFASLNPC